MKHFYFPKSYSHMQPRYRARFALLLAFASFATTYSNAGSKIYEETGGRVIIEAENYSSRVNAADGHHWHIVPTDDGKDSFVDTHTTDYLNPRGSYLVSLPDAGLNNNSEALLPVSPTVDYLINVNTPGEYQLYLRWGGWDGASDSIFVRILEVSSPGLARFSGGSDPDDADFSSITSKIAGVSGWDGYAALDNYGGGGAGITDEGPALFNLGIGVYTVRVIMREDGSALDALVLQRSDLAAPTDPGPVQSGQAVNFVYVATGPQNATATPGSTGTFAVVAEGSGTLTYQWQSRASAAGTFANIAAATRTNYTTLTATDAMNGSQYRVIVSNGTKTATSATATLITDSTSPSLTQVTGGASGTSIALQFSEPLNKVAAETLANYAVAGLSITKATLGPTGRIVILTTAVQTPNTAYSLTVNGVKDTAGNAQTGGVGSFTGATVVPNKLLVRFYRGITGSTVTDLINNAKYPNGADEVFLWDIFSSGEGTGDVFGDNYGGEITGFVTPPATGNYKFYIRSDDASRLELSTDDTAVGLRTIALQTGCCNAFTDAQGTLSSLPIALEAGKKYYLRAYWKEGGGGDWIQVGWLGPKDGDINDAASVVPIDAQYLSTGFSKVSTLAITQPPANITTPANSSTAFTVGYSANSVFGTGAAVQWQRASKGSSTFVNIVDATSPTYSIQFPSLSDSGSQYRAVISVNITDATLGNSVTQTSSAATLTVSADTTPPIVNSVAGGVFRIAVAYSEPLDAASAAAAANYKVAGGPTVSSAKLVSDAGQFGVVELTLASVTPGQTYNLTISGVKDLAGNTVVSTTKAFEAFHIIADFNAGIVPLGAAVVGSANIKASGGLDGSGFAELTSNANSLQGSLIFGDVLGGAEVTRFTVQFKLYLGNGSGNPADGFSFSLASDLAADPTAPTASFGEEGAGTGLIVAFDTYDNAGGEAPAIGIKFAGTEFAITNLAKAALVNNRWVDVLIRVNADATIDVFHDNIKYFEKLQIDGWAPIAGAQLGLGGRTGGENHRNWVDNLKVVYNADVAVNEPPSVTLNSPIDGAKIAANSSATITATATDKENQITKVEFFANGSKLGEDTTAPYSLTIPSIPQGVYLVNAKVTDAPGLVATSSTIKVTAGNPPQIMLVHATSGASATDQLLANYLISQGYDPIMSPAAPSTGADATGKALVIISSSVGSGDVADKFRDVAVPVFNWEGALQDDFLFTTNEDTITRGVLGAQTQLEITDPTHPIAGGLSGVVTISEAGVEFSWGFPVTQAKQIAKTTDGTGHVVIYAYEKGDTLLDGTTKAAERRVHVGGGDATYSGLNAAGKQLWHNAIDWALRKIGGVIAKPTITIGRSGANMTISSSDGGTVQSKDSLEASIWTSVGPAPQTVPASGSARFFRILK